MMLHGSLGHIVVVYCCIVWTRSCHALVSFNLQPSLRVCSSRDYGLSYSRCCIIATTANEQYVTIAQSLATELEIPKLDEHDDTDEFSHALQIIPYDTQQSVSVIDNYAVAIQMLEDQNAKKPRKNKNKPFFVDFCPSGSNVNNSSASRRISTLSSSKDLLIRAAAPFPGAIIVDATAGFGKDAALLANALVGSSSGSKVYMVERDPIVATLLKDGMRRLKIAAKCDAKAADLCNVLELLHVGDSTSLLQALPFQPDIVYLDPMFAPRTKSAAVKKNMQILHGLLNSQKMSNGAHDKNSDDGNQTTTAESDLLHSAMAAAKRRVVVKRHINAEELSESVKPSHVIKGSINRFDVYNVEIKETIKSI